MLPVEFLVLHLVAVDPQDMVVEVVPEVGATNISGVPGAGSA